MLSNFLGVKPVLWTCGECGDWRVRMSGDPRGKKTRKKKHTQGLLLVGALVRQVSFRVGLCKYLQVLYGDFV